MRVSVKKLQKEFGIIYNGEHEKSGIVGIKIYGIKSKLYQVIVNLVRNSLNAYKDNKLQGKITIEAEENKNEIVIKVIDNAGGIPEQIKDQLFNKILTTRGTKGTGLRIIFSLKYNRI